MTSQTFTYKYNSNVISAWNIFHLFKSRKICQKMVDVMKENSKDKPRQTSCRVHRNDRFHLS